MLETKDLSLHAGSPETWNVAHKLLGHISLPLALVYAGCALTIDNFEAVTLAAMALWIGIPGGLSLMFYRKKFRR